MSPHNNLSIKKGRFDVILYTPLPLDSVLSEESRIDQQYVNVPFENGIIEAEIISSISARIVRVRSNNVNDYLNPMLQPGTELKLKWH